MKYIIITLLFSLISCSIFNKDRINLENRKPRSIPTKDEFDTIALEAFQLKRADTTTYKYNNIFYMEKENSIYKVVTKKETIDSCEKIVIGDYYDLKIQGNYPDIFRTITLITHLIMYENEYVTIERNYPIKSDIYITPYIRGVCYIRDE